ncbi:hypothetical protein BJ878DRAFT_523698 [Calycina marina]|uniref:Uncharacterized protein n=1 Tax=Calycina marina TaxID=1763456 RepID=A0A9P8CD31_9HELO|nr:hypothetical protein BJ878DRAFT_523698 [Calycina marina]
MMVQLLSLHPLQIFPLFPLASSSPTKTYPSSTAVAERSASIPAATPGSESTSSKESGTTRRASSRYQSRASWSS